MNETGSVSEITKEGESSNGGNQEKDSDDFEQIVTYPCGEIKGFRIREAMGFSSDLGFWRLRECAVLDQH